MQIKSRKIVFECPIFKVEERQVEQNSKEETHWVVLRQPNVGMIAITKDKKIILTKEIIGAENKEVIGFPTGHLDNWEVTIEEAKKQAMAELTEEAGYQVASENVEFLQEYSSGNNWYERRYLYFIGWDAELTVIQEGGNTFEQAEAYLVSAAEAEKLANTGKLDFTNETQGILLAIKVFKEKGLL